MSMTPDKTLEELAREFAAEWYPSAQDEAARMFLVEPLVKFAALATAARESLRLEADRLVSENARLKSQLAEQRTIGDCLAAAIDGQYPHQKAINRYNDDLANPAAGISGKLFTELDHWRTAASSVGETDGHGWAETTLSLNRRLADALKVTTEATIESMSKLDKYGNRIEAK